MTVGKPLQYLLLQVIAGWRGLIIKTIMDEHRALNENIFLSSMTTEELIELLRSALRDVDTHLNRIKSVLAELRLRGKTDDELYDIEKAWKDFLEQSSVALYELDELK